jgi:hypothetical protein
MSAMQDAFARLGIRPQSQPRQSEKDRRIESAPDFRALSDVELDAEIAALDQARIVITEELAADAASPYPKGQVWRNSAGRARAYKVAHLKLANDEYNRRHPPAVVKKEAAALSQMAAAQARAEARAQEKEAKASAHQAEIDAARERKAAARAENELVWQKRQARRARMFLMAADRLLSKEERAWLWDAAREMFPDDAVWRPSNWERDIT